LIVLKNFKATTFSFYCVRIIGIFSLDPGLFSPQHPQRDILVRYLHARPSITPISTTTWSPCTALYDEHNDLHAIAELYVFCQTIPLESQCENAQCNWTVAKQINIPATKWIAFPTLPLVRGGGWWETIATHFQNGPCTWLEMII